MVLGTPMMTSDGTQDMVSQGLVASTVRPKPQLATPPPVESGNRQGVLSPDQTTPPTVLHRQREEPRGMEQSGGTVVHYHYHYHYQCCHHDGYGGGGGGGGGGLGHSQCQMGRHNHHHPRHNHNHNREDSGDRWERERPPDDMPDGAWGCEGGAESVRSVGPNFGVRGHSKRFRA